MVREYEGRTYQDWVSDLGASDFLARCRALVALSKIGVPILEDVIHATELGKVHPSSFDAVAAWLGTLDEEGISEMAESFSRAPTLVMAGLVASGDEGIPALMEALTSEGDRVRRWAAFGLGFFGDKARNASYVLEAAKRVGGSQKTVDAIETAIASILD